MKRNAPLGISTYVWPERVSPRALAALAEAGFSCVELLGQPGLCELDDLKLVKRVGRAAGRLGLFIESIHSRLTPGDLSSPDARERALQIGYVREAIAAAAELSAPVIVVHPSLRFRAPADRAERLRVLADTITELAAQAEGEGISLALENMLPDHLFDDLREQARFLRRLGLPNVGACFDSGHAHVCGNVGDAWRIAPFIICTHLHDNCGSSDDHLSLFEGSSDWQAVARALARAERARVLMLEAAPDPKGGLAATRRAAARLRAMVGRARQVASAAPGKSGR